MSKHKAQITLGPGCRGSVRLDGQEIRGVRALDVSAAWDEYPKLTIELLVSEVELNGEVITDVPLSTQEALTKLGWTPPAPTALAT